jgi:Cys-tRNA(Pro)/Cys-tRNA(Cys) deacylase
MTPSVRAAEGANREFTLHRHEHAPGAGAYGPEAAEKLGLPPERLFKTLVAQIDGKQLVLALIRADARLDLKRLAALAGGKKAELASPAAPSRLYLWNRRSLPPICCRRFGKIDHTCLVVPHQSAGDRMQCVRLASPVAIYRFLLSPSPRCG